MKILVAVSSKHGGTLAIAEAIGQELRECSHRVEVQDTVRVSDLEGVDAAIVGSAIYMGNWLPEARAFVERYGPRLSTLPVWLFSSGPLGQDEPQPRGDVAHLQELMQTTGARGHRTFVGKLDRSELGLGERLVTRVVKAPEGDFRDWEAIRGWAREIASALPAPVTSGT